MNTRARTLTHAVLGAAALLALTACPDPPEIEQRTDIYATTSAPPTATARVDNRPDNRSVALTRDVAMGVSCWSSCDEGCIGTRFTTDPPDLVEVRPVFRLNGQQGRDFVIIGKKAGSGVLTFGNACAETTYSITIIEPLAQ